MNEPFEYCPMKSGFMKLLRSSWTWVLASFVLGVLLMAAVGKANDIEKAMWFATGAAITAVATAYQTYQSNKRAADEREFHEKQSHSKLKYEEERRLREHTATLRFSAYENFLHCCSLLITDGYDNNSIHHFITAYSRLRLITEGPIITKSNEIYDHVLKMREFYRTNRKPGEVPASLGLSVREVTDLMKEDIGRSSVCIAAQAKGNHVPNGSDDGSIPL